MNAATIAQESYKGTPEQAIAFRDSMIDVTHVSRPDMKILAPQVGLEPTAVRLTAECSTIELLRNKAFLDSHAGPMRALVRWDRSEEALKCLELLIGG
jgi:hypothetical protein